MKILKKFIRKLYHLIWFLSLFLVFISPVKASIIGYQWLGRTVGDEFSISQHNATDSRTWVNVTGDSTRSYLVVDICSTTSGLVSSSIPADYDGSYTSFYQAFDTKVSCPVGGYTGTRVRLFYNIRTWADSGNGNMAINNTTRFSNTAGYTGIYKILSVGLSDNIDLGDLTINNQNIIINNINNLQSSLNNSTNNIINNNNSNRQQIIDNQNRSSGSIIDNQNRTTGSIIDNQNENTNKQIESEKVCKNIDSSYIKTTGFLDSSGSILTDYPSYGVTSYINVSSGSLKVNTIYNAGRLAFYTANKTFISAINNSSLSANSYITIPNNAKYVRFTINKSSNAPTFTLCISGNQALNDSVSDLNDNLTSDDIDSSDDTINSLKQDLPTNNVISDLMLLPVRLIQAIVNSLGGTCSSFNLGSLYGTNLIMPCIDIESVVGSTIWTFIDLVFSGVFILVIRKKFIQIFHNITNLRGGSNEVD